MEKVIFTSKKEAKKVLKELGIDFLKFKTGERKGEPRDSITVLQEKYDTFMAEQSKAELKVEDKNEDVVADETPKEENIPKVEDKPIKEEAPKVDEIKAEEKAENKTDKVEKEEGKEKPVNDGLPILPPKKIKPKISQYNRMTFRKIN